VKTVGDAYEIMLAFSPTDLKECSVADIQRAVGLSVQCSQELLLCALSIFEVLQVGLSVRCGTAIGPAFAAVIG
ncbi:hypothetical protein KIPB_017277, partial [Kipferlia bialata]